MGIELDIPEKIIDQLKKSWDDFPRRVVEALAAEGYRSSTLSSAQVQEMLRLKSRWDTDAFLKLHGCYLDYSEEDLSRDIAAIRKATGR